MRLGIRSLARIRHSGESRNPVSFDPLGATLKSKSLDDQLRCYKIPPAFAGMTSEERRQ
jgi:hypothetical protein